MSTFDIRPRPFDISRVPTSPFYRLLARAGVAGVRLASLLSPKARKGDAGRRGSPARILAWAATSRDPDRPLLWMHAPSVGEGLQALAVLDRLRARHPDWQVVYTHFSPSAEALAARAGADLSVYIPYDLRGTIGPVLDALAPTAVVFAKLDLWPELSVRAAERGSRVGIVAGTVSPVSSRTRWPVRHLLRAGYRAVDLAGAIAESDAERLMELGVDPGRVRVLGDPRFDSVLDAMSAVPSDEPLLRFGRSAPTLVAGSTWPEDEEVVLASFARVHALRPDARLILAPHEPTEAHLAAIMRTAARRALPVPVRLADATSPTPLLLVDRVGVLARLYGAGTISYVGGGFGRAGLHSVLEPAAWALPVIHGPRWQASREAGLLLAAGGGISLPPSDATGPLAELWLRWIEDDPARVEAGRRALAVVTEGLGAAERNAELVEALMES